MKCPNCGQKVKDDAERCPYCNFDLKKFNTAYFTNHNDINHQENHDASKQPVFLPKKQNPTIAAMINWIQVNAIIVFLTGIGLLILMSFSRPLAWLTFFALMIWLFIICQRHPKTEQYTADRRLAEKVNQVGSNVANSVEERQERIKNKRSEYGKKPLVHDIQPSKRNKLSLMQLGIMLMACISLFVIFFGPFASTSLNSVPSSSITKVLVNIAGLGGEYSLIGYGLLLLFLAVPIAIIVLTIKNKNYSKRLVFFLSLVETIFLVLVAFELIFRNVGSSLGILNSHTTGYLKQIMDNIISFGISTYMLLISSILTTWLSWQSLKNKKVN